MKKRYGIILAACMAAAVLTACQGKETDSRSRLLPFLRK